MPKDLEYRPVSFTQSTIQSCSFRGGFSHTGQRVRDDGSDAVHHPRVYVQTSVSEPRELIQIRARERLERERERERKREREIEKQI